MSAVALSAEEELAFVRGLVERYSPSGDEEPAREYLLTELPELGYRVETDEVGNVLATTGDPDADREVFLTSHMDTVPGEIDVRVEDGALHGRGSVDAKGPLAAMCLAGARALVEDARVTVAAVVEEEESGLGARHLVEERAAPTFLVNGEPSGWDTVTLGYRGILRFRYRVTGEVIHTARPGVNAIEDVMGFWHDVAGAVDGDDGFGSLHATATRIDSDNDGFELESQLRGNVRIPPDRTVAEIRDLIGGIAEDWQGKVYWGESTEPVLVDRSNPVATSFRRAVRDAGGEPALSVKTGTSDMNVFAERWDCPMVTYGPGDSNLDHTPDEHIQLDGFHRAVDVLERVVGDLAEG